MTDKEIAKVSRKRIPKKKQVFGLEIIEGDQAAAIGRREPSRHPALATTLKEAFPMQGFA